VRSIIIAWGREQGAGGRFKNIEYRTEPLEFALASESGELGEANIEFLIHLPIIPVSSP